MSKKFSIGVDLGTSNSCISICSIDPQRALAGVTGVAIPQVLSPGVIGDKALLPSALYLPTAEEIASGSLGMPWHPGQAGEPVAGSYARDRASEVPDRVVTSAKSWLCNGHVDRRGAILPWLSELAAQKLSPFEASQRYLAHMRQALAAHLAQHYSGAGLADCTIVLTVPASFDEVARELTYDAALAAGMSEVVLLEEPQAAFYAWIGGAGEGGAQAWQTQVAAGDVVLVCDVGGGTTDFSLIAVADAPDGLSRNLALHRIAVGEHILLGGDNMDLAVAYLLKGKIESDGAELDHWQFLALVHAARAAKERMLADPSVAELSIAVPSRSANLFAATRSTTLAREELLALLVEGYFPLTAAGEQPAQRKSVGLQEYGLDFATEPAISKHLARFLARAMQNVASDETLRSLVGQAGSDPAPGMLRPSAVLFNGGVFEAPLFRARVMELLENWLGQRPRELPSVGLDIAVSRGAAYFGAVRASGKGIKIRAGTSRSYYLGLESPAPAVPGHVPPVKGICIVPQGSEEGSDFELPERRFGLVTGEPVEFRFFSSEVRAGDRVGSVVGNALRELQELSRLTVTLPPLDGEVGQVVPVALQPRVTDVGTLELWLQHTQSERRWRLEFNLRAEG